VGALPVPEGPEGLLPPQAASTLKAITTNPARTARPGAIRETINDQLCNDG
jgi:hypothetical protein